MLDSFGTDTIRMIFAFLDRLAYSLVGTVYGFIKELAQIQIFSGSDISAFASKIYGILGLFMLFKVSFSLLNYIVDPDSVEDKTKGAGAIAKNIIIVLVMIIIAPFAFDLLSDAQNIILDEGIIERFVFGNGESKNQISKLDFQMNEEVCGNNIAKAASDGDYVALQVFKGFYQPESAYSDMGEEDKSNRNRFLIEDDYCPSGKVTVSNYLKYKLYSDAGGLSYSGDDDYYIVDYTFLWSTIVGVVTLLLFLNICIEITKRSIKLGFLEIIAPIPIISYVDPKSGKDGLFKKWLKQVGSTWASLFVRLAAIYFSIYLIQIVTVKIDDEKIWMKIFIILGCLMFAKELPKLIEQLVPGLNASGKFTLSPLKNIRENALFGNAVLGLPSAAIGKLGGIGSNAWAAHQRNSKARQLVDKEKYLNEDGEWRGATKERKAAFKAAYKRKLEENGYMNAGSVTRSLIAGGASAGFRSFWNTAKSGKIISGAEQGITKSSSNRNLRRDSGYGLDDRIKDKATDIAGVRSSSGTTSLLKNKVNENTFRIENAKRDEVAATRAMQDMAMADNGAKFREFMDAFKQLSRTVNKNTHGVDVTYQYADYKSYVDARKAEGYAASDPRLLTEQEFTNYQAAVKIRDNADSMAHQLTYENEMISKQQNAYKKTNKQ